MPTKPKIKIVDNNQLRAEIDELYEKTSQIDLAKWSLSIAKHILDIVGIDYNLIADIADGFQINELWQLDKAGMHDVRQTGFKIHKLARECDDEIRKTALRVAGQAVGSGHMREHAMVASDYAVKTIGLLNSNNINAVTREREWQLNELKRISQHRY
ncbi:putative immunity protein [Carnobacterium alterfunditum]|uniref:putative immunity protein n=1 Tax=Carnobacterium alterfunditum TaxID=28230 RepID=UPI003593A273